MHLFKPQFFFLFLTLILAHSLAQGQLVPSDNPYFVSETPKYHYILTKDVQKYLQEIISSNEKLKAYYESSYQWKLEERTSLVLASHSNQIANGFATVSPNTLTFFYPTGFEAIDSFASSTWFSVLLAHESAHLYQLDAKGKVSSWFRKVIGNPLVIITPFVPVFIHPNQLAPQFLLEGNAVMNESLFNIGGRLHSGEVRALVFSLIKDEKVTSERLFNEHLFYPYTSEKYLVGGYFNLFLAEKFGIDKTNQFFLEQGQRFIWPLRVNQTFRTHFGDSYTQLLRQFNLKYKRWAQKQKTSSQPSVLTSLRYAPLNSSKESIWFLTQKDLSQNPTLHRHSKSNNSWTNDSVDLPIGKVFYIDGQPASVSTRRHSLKKIEYSLYKEGLEFIPEYRSQIVQDQKNGVTAAIDAKQQFFYNRLFLNGIFFTNVHSSVVLSQSQEPIYFRQEKNVRTLFKGKQPVAAYLGYYGKPLEETDSGALTFIANTEFGSSLFEVDSSGTIYRLHLSDLIVDARQVSKDSFLIVETHSSGYQYKFVKTQKIQQTPTHYIYPVDKSNRPDLSDFTFTPQKIDSGKLRNYSLIKDLRYSSTNLFIQSANPGGVDGFAQTIFVDPLFYNSISATFERIFDSNSFGLQYQLQKYIFQPYVGYAYIEDRIKPLGGQEEDALFFHNQQTFLGFQAPIFIHKRFRGNWSSDFSYEKTETLNNQFSEKTEWTHSLTAQYLKNYPLNYEPYRQHQLKLTQQTITAPGTQTKQDSIVVGKISFSGDVGKNNYFSLSLAQGLAEKQNIKLQTRSLIQRNFLGIERLYNEKSFFVKEIKSLMASYKKPFSTPLYFTRLPISFRRMVLYGEVAYYDIESHRNVDSHFFDHEVGVEIEAIVIHRAPARFRLGYTKTSEGSLNQYRYFLNANFRL